MFFLVVYQTFFCWLEKTLCEISLFEKLIFEVSVRNISCEKHWFLGQYKKLILFRFVFCFFLWGRGWKNFLDNYVLGVFIDLSNAFDTIDL